jgi:hypothetical protein
MRKSFTGPFWWVVALGAFYVLQAAANLLLGKPGDGGVWFVLLSLLWVVILIVEAVLYWRIRKRNEARKESWAHVVTLGFTFLVPVFKGAMIEAFFGEVFGEQIGKELLDYFSWEKTALYWTLMVMAHVFFGRVVWKAFAGRSSAVRAGEGLAVGDGGVAEKGIGGEQGKEQGGARSPQVGITILPEPEQKDLLDDIWN